MALAKTSGGAPFHPAAMARCVREQDLGPRDRSRGNAAPARFGRRARFRVLPSPWHRLQRCAKPFKAIEILARGVATFPKDARLYSHYTQYIKAEADTVVPRGLALFPKNADLLALNAKELRARGQIEESLTPRKSRRDRLGDGAGPTHGRAARVELGRPDSAIAALHRALARGEDSALVARSRCRRQYDLQVREQ